MLGAHHEGSGGIYGRAYHWTAWFFHYRHGFAGDHAFVNGAYSFEDDAVDGNFFARTYSQAVAQLYLIEGNVTFRTIAQNASGFRAEIK